MSETVRLFHRDLEGTFLSRPNRFLVHIRAQGRIVAAHCANPGRLIELLVPGRRVILERSPGAARKTKWTLAAVYFQGKVIPLISVRANRAAGSLVLPALFPDADRIKAEHTEGESRFDYLVEDRDHREYIEVKNCTLSAAGRAMFPDAPTERGVRHLRHLQRLVREGESAAGESRQKPGAKPTTGDSKNAASILFIISHPDAHRFTPNIHTDPAFALTLEDVSREVNIRTSGLSCTSDGWCSLTKHMIEADLAPVAHARADRGAYLIALRLDSEKSTRTGALGMIRYPAGWYLYCGSAKQGRTARHLRLPQPSPILQGESAAA